MINSASQIIVYSPDVNLNEKKSTINNDVQSIVTYQDMLDGVSVSSISANGFTVVSPLSGNITLPSNSNVQYNSPLVLGPGCVLTVPVGTTLTII